MFVLTDWITQTVHRYCRRKHGCIRRFKAKALWIKGIFQLLFTYEKEGMLQFHVFHQLFLQLLVMFECGQSTSENGTLFMNPSTITRMCNLNINRMNDDICQIRLDFETFELGPPNDSGVCEDDFFLVTGGTVVPPLCGSNSGEHSKFQGLC